MILGALCDYYERLAADPDRDVPRRGYSMARVSFCLLLDQEGGLLEVQDIRDTTGKKPRPRPVPVPEAVKRTVGIAANFLWDKTDYVLGAARQDPRKKVKPERLEAMFRTFGDNLRDIAGDTRDEGILAVMRFLDAWDPATAPSLPLWEEMAGENLVFRLDGDLCHVHDRPAARRAWLERSRSSDDTMGICLVSGEREPIARLHQDIKGVRGAQTKGASLVSFNLDAFASFGKSQSFNAPVGERAAFAYTTALNHLLAEGSRQRVTIGDATTVFWAERGQQAEDLLALLLNPPAPGEDPRGESAEGVCQVHEVLAAASRGELPPGLDPGVTYFVLGLSPNASRLAVRFWYQGSTGELVARIGQHYQDLALERQYDSDALFPPPWMLLRETAPLRDSRNIPPLLAGHLMRAVLGGGPYPRALLTAVLARMRADKTVNSVNYLRAALVKACILRNQRILNTHTMEVNMALNTESRTPAYLLGRLFAVLEKAQRDAVPGAGATIKDRFYGAASATPRAVFPQLLRLAQHHIQKAEWGRHTDQRIAEIMEGLEVFPAHLSLDDQGLFALGYYQQRNALFRPSTDKKNQEQDPCGKKE